MNNFEQACIEATKNNWCWKIHCSTCGNHEFYLLFAELCQTTDRFDLSLDKGTALEAFITADIQYISKSCRFPDWLGYLGLVLHNFNYPPEQLTRLSRNWSKQLLTIVPKSSRAFSILNDISNDEHPILTPRTMELCERAIMTGV